MNRNYDWYATLRKPAFAPPPWLFAPVWTLLYAIIAISFGYVGYMFFVKLIPFYILLPFVLNLVFNFAFTPILFRLKNLELAAVDVMLVFASLVWAMFVIYPYARFVLFANIPYLLWVLFASVLQLTITFSNRTRNE